MTAVVVKLSRPIPREYLPSVTIGVQSGLYRRALMLNLMGSYYWGD
jgi:hypothetical protein